MTQVLMNPEWYFRAKHPGDDITDPISGEFFADGSLDNPATALVREALQNALDAGKDTGEDVHVRIGLFRRACLPARAAEHWFGTLRPHVDLPGNGLKDAPAAGEPCDYLIVEDFGTSGLTGDTESDSAIGARNNFVDFIRSDGRTRKSAGDKGSWGVGKNVFPRSSRVNAFIAYTVRRDDGRRLVMGKAILKIRRIQDTEYQPACYLGASWKRDEVPRPCEDDEIARRLRDDFSLARNGEFGLSLVIPWPDPDIGFSDLLRAVVGQFYYAILVGGLSVTMVDDGAEIVLTRETLPQIVEERLPIYSEWVALARWSLDQGDPVALQAPEPNAPQKWSDDLVTEEVRAHVTESLNQRERVAIRVPLHVTPANQPTPQATFFDIFLEHHDDPKTLQPSFFREQLSISSVKRAVGVPRVRALVVINEDPIATLLRAAEPPNHTDWDPKTANFKSAYRNGNYVITFVKSAVKQLMVSVRAGDDAPDPNIAIDFFGVTEPQEHEGPPAEPRRKQKTGNEPPAPFGGMNVKPKALVIDRLHGGFVIRRSNPAGMLPPTMHVTMAYDVLIGSPWKQFDRLDFDLSGRGRSGLSIEAAGGVEFRVVAPNRVQLSLNGSDFEFRMTGFDANRDLIVRVYNPRERRDANTAPELYEAEEADA